MAPKPIRYDKLKGVLPPEDFFYQCIHCGMCLATCPTYNKTLNERSSPRGRIRLMKKVAEGELPMTAIFADEMEFCLDCQACETACPAGVQYGPMVEAARVETTKAGYGGPLKRLMKKIGMNVVLSSKFWLKFVGRLIYAYQNFGLRWLVRKSRILKLVGNMERIEELTPTISRTYSESVLAERIPAYGETRYRIAFLTGCLMDVCFADINLDTVEALRRNGCEIIVPKKQVCCGSLQGHYGERDKALSLARVNIDAFMAYDFDYLITNSAGCAAFMKEYAHFFKDDPVYAERAAALSAKTRDVMEFLGDIELNEADLKPLAAKATYHDACHLAHTQKITEQPRNVLAAIPGLELIPLEESTWCCGSAGIYNVLRYDDSMWFLDRKMDNIERTGATIVTTGNPGCMGQIAYGAKLRKLDLETLHPITLVRRSYDGGKAV